MHYETNMPGSIRVFFTDISGIGACSLEQLLHMLPAGEKAKLLSFRLETDRLRGAIGKHLLEKMWQEYGCHSGMLHRVKTDSYERPYIDGAVDFNISHSGNRVIIAAGHHLRLGVDVEKIKPLEIDEFAAFFSLEEIDSIKKTASPLKAFYKQWTRKESVLKANGKGLHLPPDEVLAEDDIAWCEQQKWFLYTLDLGEDYACHIASSRQCSIELRQLWCNCSNNEIKWTEVPN
jgi:4'-phosphopantetheinyl transferase